MLDHFLGSQRVSGHESNRHGSLIAQGEVDALSRAAPDVGGSCTGTSDAES